MIANAREAYTNYKVKLTKKIEELKEELAKLEKKKKRKKPKETEKKAEIKLTETKLEEAPAVEKQIESLAKRIATEQVNLLQHSLHYIFTTIQQLPATLLYDLGPTREVLSELIDKWKGANVRDQKIFREHAAKYEQEFLEDMNALGVRPPDVMTRVTEYIPEVIAFVKKIIEVSASLPPFHIPNLSTPPPKQKIL